MIRGITWTHIQSVWNHSDPSKVPYLFRKPVTGQKLFLLFLTANQLQIHYFFFIHLDRTGEKFLHVLTSRSPISKNRALVLFMHKSEFWTPRRVFNLLHSMGFPIQAQGSEVRTPTEHDFQGPKWLLEQSLHSVLFSPITSIH